MVQNLICHVVSLTFLIFEAEMSHLTHCRNLMSLRRSGKCVFRLCFYQRILSVFVSLNFCRTVYHCANKLNNWQLTWSPHVWNLCFISLGLSHQSGTNLHMYFHVERRATGQMRGREMAHPGTERVRPFLNKCWCTVWFSLAPWSPMMPQSMAVFSGQSKISSFTCWLSKNDHTRHQDLLQNWTISQRRRLQQLLEHF